MISETMLNTRQQKWNIAFCMIVLITMVCSPCISQIDYDKIFPVLNQPIGATNTATGDVPLQHIENDVNAGVHNPALLSVQGALPISFSYSFLPADINRGSLVGAFTLKKAAMDVIAGLQYMNFGQLQGFNEEGQATSLIKASESVFFLGASRQLYDKLRLGAATKIIFSSLGEFNSSGMGFDLGAAYILEDSSSELGLVVKNLGFQFNAYGNEKEPFPVDIQAAWSVKLAHLPLRFGITAHKLNHWELRYDNPYNVDRIVNIDDPFADPSIKKYNMIDNVMRHLILHTEVRLGRKDGFRIRAAYNHFRKRELSVNGTRSLAGFSLGAGIRVSKFYFDYGYSIYHLAGGVHALSLGTNLKNFSKKSL